MKVIGRLILLVSAGLGYILNMNPHVFTNLLVFTKGDVIKLEIPKQLCQPNHFDPMHNRYKH